MLKKTIKYTDYNGIERQEDFWFNLSKAELTEMELTTVGGFDGMVQKIIAARDVPTLINLFKEIILKSYGEKSADGRRFIKINENGHRLVDQFVQTEAYSNLFMELATDDKAAADFVNGIVPSDVSAKASEAMSTGQLNG